MPKDVFPNYPRTPDHSEDGDPIGRTEMGQVSGRTRAAVAKWIERGALPLADGPKVDGVPTWRRRTFMAWAHREGMLEDAYGKRMPHWEEGRDWAHHVDPTRLVSVRELRELGKLPPE